MRIPEEYEQNYDGLEPYIITARSRLEEAFEAAEKCGCRIAYKSPRPESPSVWLFRERGRDMTDFLEEFGL